MSKQRKNNVILAALLGLLAVAALGAWVMMSAGDTDAPVTTPVKPTMEARR